MKTILLSIILLLGSNIIQAQKGSLKVLLQDKSNKEAIPFANIIVYQKGVQVKVATTNMDGECRFDSLPIGKYDVKGVYVGYMAAEIKNVAISKNKTCYINISLTNGEGVTLNEVEVVTYQIPLSDPDTKSGQTVTREDYQNMATKDINSVAATTTGIFRKDRGKNVSVRGGREDAKWQWFSNSTEKYEKSPENTFKKTKNNPLSTFSSDVDVASYANVRRFINQGILPPKEAVRTEEMVNYFRYEYPQPINDEPFSINTELSVCPWNTQHQLLQVGIQGRSIDMTNSLPNNLTFLIDVSGSMDQPDKLPLLKSALTLLVEQLKDNDRVAMVVYAGSAGLVLPSTKGNKKEKIIEALHNLQAGGSTAGGEGIQLAYTLAKENFISKGNNRVILATDGDFNVGISSDDELVKLIEAKRDDGIYLTVLGFGTGNYQDSKMEKLADKGNGNYAYIDNILEAKKVLVKELGGTLITIAKDVKIQVEFNPKQVKEYRLIGYENRILADEDFNDDKKDAGEVGSGHSVTALYEIIPSGSKESLSNIDKLKYQNNAETDLASLNEIATIKLRYKEPKENESKLILKAISKELISPENTSENFKFCSAVAQFSLLLIDSKHKGKISYDTIIKQAKSAKGKDDDGYRAEFIKLCETAQLLTKN
jgi:Ca-activated chloride channel family protein